MNTSTLQEFQYEGTPIQVLGEPNKPLFIAKEVCTALGLSDVYRATERLDDDEKLTRKLFVSGQRREMTVINEPGLYNLVLRSTKPEAKKFKRWVTHEVLPAIRKKGRFEMRPNELPPARVETEKVIALQERVIALQQQLLDQAPEPVEKPEKEYRPPADMSVKKEVYRLRSVEDMSWAEISGAVGYSRSSCRNYYLEMKAGGEVNQ